MHLAVFCPRCAGTLERRIPEHDARERRVCSLCGFVLYDNPKIAAGTLPVRDGQVALIRRRFEPARGLWSWPCGYVEIDETVEQGAVRETAEECGLQVELGELLGIYSYPLVAADGATPTTGVVVIAFAASAPAGELVAGDDADRAVWCDLDALPWDDLAFRSTRAALRDLLTRRGLPPQPARGPASHETS